MSEANPNYVIIALKLVHISEARCGTNGYNACTR